MNGPLVSPQLSLGTSTDTPQFFFADTGLWKASRCQVCELPSLLWLIKRWNRRETDGGESYRPGIWSSFLPRSILQVVFKMASLIQNFLDAPDYSEYSPWFPNPLIVLRDVVRSGASEVYARLPWNGIGVWLKETWDQMYNIFGLERVPVPPPDCNCIYTCSSCSQPLPAQGRGSHRYLVIQV